MSSDFDETRELWDRTAKDWKVQVGDTGDRNRVLNSDPVLWEFLGDVAGKRVLDAGCGTGYLTRQLAAKGALVTGVDFSPQMIAIAQKDSKGIEYRVDSCSELATCKDAEFDVLVSNYVVMDVPDMDGVSRAFYRVLRPAGTAVMVFSHPCFPGGSAERTEDGVTYEWKHSYFEQRKRVDPIWGHFKENFIWFHRPLSDYWKSFAAAGFVVTGFEEPRISGGRLQLAKAQEVSKLRMQPFSVAFRLSKPA